MKKGLKFNKSKISNTYNSVSAQHHLLIILRNEISKFKDHNLSLTSSSSQNLFAFDKLETFIIHPKLMTCIIANYLIFVLT